MKSISSRRATITFCGSSGSPAVTNFLQFTARRRMLSQIRFLWHWPSLQRRQRGLIQLALEAEGRPSATTAAVNATEPREMHWRLWPAKLPNFTTSRLGSIHGPIPERVVDTLCEAPAAGLVLNYETYAKKIHAINVHLETKNSPGEHLTNTTEAPVGCTAGGQQHSLRRS